MTKMTVETTPPVNTETAAPAAAPAAIPPATPDPAPAAKVEEKPAAPAKVEEKPAAAAVSAVTEEFKPYEIAPPEGIKVDEVSLKEFNAFANDLKIPKDKAEAFSHQFAKKQVEAVQQQIAGWRTLTEADKELGGANYEQNVGIAKKAFQKYGTPELLKVLETTGLGNHPEIIRWAHRVGKAMSDDVVITQNGGTPKSEPTFASALMSVANSNNGKGDNK